MRTPVPVLLAAALLAGCSANASQQPAKPRATRPPSELAAGWRTDFSRHSVPFAEIGSGGPGKDGIPAIDHPHFAPADRVDFLRPREPVIELTVHGETRGYPLQILIWHEIANDDIRGAPVAVTFCPLCNTAIAFDRRVGGRTLDFGVSGNLRNSDLVMYDRRTDSWWQQFGGEAIVGRYTGTRLRQLPARIVSWADFRRRHSNALVLSRQTGYERPYGQNPYVGYDDVSKPPFFGAAHADDRRLAPKQRVVFLERGRDAVVIPFSTPAKRRTVTVTVGGHTLVVRFTASVASALDQGVISSGRDVGAAQVTENGKPVPFDEPFWFAVAAFRPHETAQRMRFLGSPTVRVDGVDVEPHAEQRHDYVQACRVYRTDAGFAGQPQESWIRDALKTAAAGP
jgi:hypothetical protein